MRKPSPAASRVLALLTGRTCTFRELETLSQLSNTGLRVILAQLVNDGRVTREAFPQPAGRKGAPFYIYRLLSTEPTVAIAAPAVNA